MPRGRKLKAVSLEDRLNACNTKIEKLTLELKDLKSERTRLLNEKAKYDQEEIIRAIQSSGKSKEDIMKALQN